MINGAVFSYDLKLAVLPDGRRFAAAKPVEPGLCWGCCFYERAEACPGNCQGSLHPDTEAGIVWKGAK